jgi:hypothetical protein
VGLGVGCSRRIARSHWCSTLFLRGRAAGRDDGVASGRATGGAVLRSGESGQPCRWRWPHHGHRTVIRTMPLPMTSVHISMEQGRSTGPSPRRRQIRRRTIGSLLFKLFQFLANLAKLALAAADPFLQALFRRFRLAGRRSRISRVTTLTHLDYVGRLDDDRDADAPAPNRMVRGGGRYRDRRWHPFSAQPYVEHSGVIGAM